MEQYKRDLLVQSLTEKDIKAAALETERKLLTKEARTIPLAVLKRPSF